MNTLGHLPKYPEFDYRHTLRKPDGAIEKYALQWNPTGDRKIGRPRGTWRRSVNKELERVDKTWYEARRIEIERTEWNTLVATLFSKYDLKEKMEIDELIKNLISFHSGLKPS